MIGLSKSQFKELPFSVILSILFLSIIGLVVLNSISQHQEVNFLSNPFNKQLIFLIPAIFISIIIILIPRYSIHKYSYPLYLD